VAVIGELLHRRVFEVAHAVSEHGEERSRRALGLDEPNEISLARRANVEVAVRREDHAVDSLALKALARHSIRELNAGCSVGRASRFELVDGASDAILLIA